MRLPSVGAVCGITSPCSFHIAMLHRLTSHRIDLLLITAHPPTLDNVAAQIVVWVCFTTTRARLVISLLASLAYLES